MAIAVYVENAGWGDTLGVPIGYRIMEKYLKDSIGQERKDLEDRMINASKLRWSNIKK